VYTGALSAVSNRETWTQSFTITNGDNGTAVDLTGAVVTIGIREPEALMPRVTYTSGDGKLAILTPATNGVFMINADFDPSLFPPAMYEVGVMIRLAGGTKRTIVVATLPVVDGVVTSS
jgi:hypothetical protein